MSCFCRVVQTGSFAAAARDLDCSRSAVTNYIRFLEEWTSTRLLARTTRSMQLTVAGEQFYAYCLRVEADTRHTLDGLRAGREQVSGRLVVAAPVSLTLSFLSDHLHAFQALHPAVELDVRVSDSHVDLVRDGIDVALRGQGALADSSLVAVPVLTMQRSVCAAPAYWQRAGRPSQPKDLIGMNCLAYVLGSDASAWQFEGPGGAQVIDIQGSFRASNSLLLIDAMLRGIGVGLVPDVLVSRHLQEHRLETVLADYAVEPRVLYALYPSRRHLPAAVRAFIAFLKRQLGSESPATGP